MLMFINSSCSECKKGATQLAKLGKMTMDRPKIGRVDCTFDLEPCDLLVKHIPASNNTFPYIMMLTRERTHVWEGPIIAEEIYTKFIKGKGYQNFPHHGGKGYTTKRILQEGREYIVKIQESF